MCRDILVTQDQDIAGIAGSAERERVAIQDLVLRAGTRDLVPLVVIQVFVGQGQVDFPVTAVLLVQPELVDSVAIQEVD